MKRNLRSIMKNLTQFCSFLVLVFILCNCSKKKPYKDAFTAIKQDSAAYGDPKTIQTISSEQNPIQVCEVKEMSWTPGDGESILMQPTGWSFPGNVLDATSLQDGRYRTIPGDRKPINLIISSPAFVRRSITVDKPGQKSIEDSIKVMLDAGKSGTEEADITISAKEIYSEEHLKLAIKSKYTAGFGSIAAGFDFKNSNISKRYLLDITQVYYTINVEAPNGGFFNALPDGLTPESPSPIYISGVKYGRRIMLIVEMDESQATTQVDFAAKMKAISQEQKLDMSLFTSNFLSNKSVKLLAKGGKASTIFSAFRAIDNRDSLFSIISKDATWSKDNLGVPLGYEVKNCSNNDVFYLSQSGTYKARICEFKTQKDTTFTIGNLERLCAWHVGGKDRNFKGNPKVEFSIQLETHKNIVMCNINMKATEQGGDNTTGIVQRSIKIIDLPEDYTILEVTPKNIVQSGKDLENKGLTPFTFASSFPVSLVSIIGDSDGNNNDDLYPGACVDDIHCQIRQIVFNPITVKYTRKLGK